MIPPHVPSTSVEPHRKQCCEGPRVLDWESHRTSFQSLLCPLGVVVISNLEPVSSIKEWEKYGLSLEVVNGVGGIPTEMCLVGTQEGPSPLFLTVLGSSPFQLLLDTLALPFSSVPEANTVWTLVSTGFWKLVCSCCHAISTPTVFDLKFPGSNSTLPSTRKNETL